MSDDEFGFAPPAFKPDEGLQRLRRELRGLGLDEREGAYERRGIKFAQARLVDGELQAALARTPARSPEWQPRTLRHSADIRDFVADAKQRVAKWNQRDD